MKINLNFLYLLPVFAVLFTEGLFYDIFFGYSYDTQTQGLVNVVTALSVVASLLLFKKLNPALKNWFLLFGTFLLLLVLESYYTYGTLFVYPHVFARITNCFIIFALYGFYTTVDRKMELLDVAKIVTFIIAGLLLNISLINSKALSVASFTSHERGIVVNSAYFIMIPCLYFFNKYVFEKRQHFLLLFFVFLFAIVFFQHRTIYVCTVVALTLNVFLINWKSGVRFNLNTLLPFALYATVAGFIIISFVFTAKPEILDKLISNIDDIQNYQTQGTGGWRFQQTQEYLPFIEDNWLIGTRFRGFELPIQFYQVYHEWDGDINIPIWPDGTGHHLHSSYVETLFYFGLSGFLVFYLPAIIYFVGKIRKKDQLTVGQLTLLCFCFSGLVFSYSYSLPPYYFGLVGVAARLLDQPDVSDEDEEGALREERQSATA